MDPTQGYIGSTRAYLGSYCAYLGSKVHVPAEKKEKTVLQQWMRGNATEDGEDAVSASGETEEEKEGESVWLSFRAWYHSSCDLAETAPNSSVKR